MINKEDFKPIPIDKIDISKWNVRTLDKEKGIEDLVKSILKYELLQPIVVFREEDKYNLIIGQRRLRAFKELKKKGYSQFEEIPAVILPKKPDEEQAKILSLSENIQRVELNRQDIVETISFLFQKHKSVKTVAKLLGIHPLTVSGYLPIVNAPAEIKGMYYKKQITKADVKRLMLIAPDDKGRMIELAKGLPTLAKEEKERLVDVAIRLPKAPPKKLFREAKRPHVKEEIVVPLTPALLKALDSAVKTINLSREEIARNALAEWLSDKGYYKE